MCVEYSGVYTQYLPKLGDKTSLLTVTLNGISEAGVISFMSTLEQYSGLVREECHDAVLPFLCQYVFPPCNVSSGNVSIISHTQCSNIRDAVCSVEWNIASKLSPSAASLLPNCENFNDDDNLRTNCTTVLTMSLSI